ncbi:hypothetical protein SANTM175S_05713 [Streptomyces antimycoticus]
MDEDRVRRFDPERPPLLRFTLIHMGDRLARFLMTNHHLLLDGWSGPLLMRELFALYQADGDESALPDVTPYRDYLAWLGRQDKQAAREAWRTVLSGLDGATLIAPDSDGRTAEAPATCPWNSPNAPPLDPDRAGPTPRGDPEHGRAGGLERGAVRADRPDRRGVRRDRLRPPGRPPGCGDHGRPVHQHRPGPRRAEADRHLGDAAGAAAGPADGGDGPPLPGPSGRAAPGRAGHAVRHDRGDRELSAGRRRNAGRRGRFAHHRHLRLGRQPLPDQPGGDAGRALRLRLGYRPDVVDREDSTAAAPRCSVSTPRAG